METIHERCCGLDVHKKTVVACFLVSGPQGHIQQEVRTFGTMTADLLALADWLTTAECTHVAMESTGVYWKPIFNLLEGVLTVLVVNAQHLKAVPGRKTDVKDAVWIANLMRHGLLQGSFIPPTAQRELRDLTRYRSSLVQELASGQPIAESPRRRQHQAGWCRNRHHWCVGSSDARSSGSGRG